MILNLYLNSFDEQTEEQHTVCLWPCVLSSSCYYSQHRQEFLFWPKWHNKHNLTIGRSEKSAVFHFLCLDTNMERVQKQNNKDRFEMCFSSPLNIIKHIKNTQCIIQVLK